MCISSSSVINADIVHQRALTITNVRTKNGEQHIYPDIKFSCNGTVTKWIYGAEVSSDGAVRPELQIWHQTGPDTYTKIGFSSVTANATASPNVHEYCPETTLQFQQGDVLGVYYPDTDASNIVIYAQKESGPLNYHILDNIAPSTLTISDLTISGNDFPLVSVVISKSSPIMTMGTARNSQDPTMVSHNIETLSILIFVRYHYCPLYTPVHIHIELHSLLLAQLYSLHILLLVVIQQPLYHRSLWLVSVTNIIAMI